MMAKFRNGFVSNSSSSSFIVYLPQDIRDYSLESFTKLINPQKKYEDSDTPTEVMVEKLYKDLHSKACKNPSQWIIDNYIGKKLEENEYHIEYGDDWGVIECDMEHEFMPSLSITKKRINRH